MALTTEQQTEIQFFNNLTRDFTNMLVQEAMQTTNGLLSADNKTLINANIEKIQTYVDSLIPVPAP